MAVRSTTVTHGESYFFLKRFGLNTIRNHFSVPTKLANKTLMDGIVMAKMQKRK